LLVVCFTETEENAQIAANLLDIVKVARTLVVQLLLNGDVVLKMLKSL